MPVTDPIADYLTRLRNAIGARKKYVEMPSSKMKVTLSGILQEYKFIKDYSVAEDNKQNVLRVNLQYIDGIPSISGLKKISKPGLRQYVDKDSIPRVYNGLGIAVISTSKGLLSDKQAKAENVGGEVICHIW